MKRAAADNESSRDTKSTELTVGETFEHIAYPYLNSALVTHS